MEELATTALHEACRVTVLPSFTAVWVPRYELQRENRLLTVQVTEGACSQSEKTANEDNTEKGEMGRCDQ